MNSLVAHERFPHNSIDSTIQSICDEFSKGSDASWVVVSCLTRELRRKLCPHTLDLHNMKKWDVRFAHLLLQFVLKTHPQVCWRRLLVQILTEDLQRTPPFDGTEGLVRMAYHQSVVLFSLAATNQDQDMLHFCRDGSSFDSGHRWKNQFSRSSFAHTSSHCPEGWTALHHAAWAGHQQAIVSCLQLGIGLDAADARGDLPLHTAARACSHQAISFLVKAGSSILHANKRGQYPLYLLVQSMSMSNWRERITLRDAVDCIGLLSDPDRTLIWDTSKTSILWEEHTFSLMLCVCGNDAYLVRSVLQTACSGARELWVVSLIRFNLLAAIRRRHDAAAALIFDYFSDILVLSSPSLDRSADAQIADACLGESDIAKLHFFQYAALCAISAKDQDMTNVLVRQLKLVLSALSSISTGFDYSQKLFLWILLFAVVQCNDQAIGEVLALMNSEATILSSLASVFGDHSVPTPLSLCLSVGVEESVFQRSRIHLYVDKDIIAGLANFSPLSLACVFNLHDVVRKMLGFLPNKLDLPSISSQRHQLCLRCPLFCSALMFNYSMLCCLRDHLGLRGFQAALFSQEDKGPVALHCMFSVLNSKLWSGRDYSSNLPLRNLSKASVLTRKSTRLIIQRRDVVDCVELILDSWDGRYSGNYKCPGASPSLNWQLELKQLNERIEDTESRLMQLFPEQFGSSLNPELPLEVERSYAQAELTPPRKSKVSSRISSPARNSPMSTPSRKPVLIESKVVESVQQASIVSSIIRVRDRLELSEKRWTGLLHRLSNRESFKTNMHILMKTPKLEQMWNKFAQCLCLVLQPSSLPASKADSRSIKPLGQVKPTEWWDKLVTLVGMGGRQHKSSSSSKGTEKVDVLLDKLRQYSCPFQSYSRSDSAPNTLSKDQFIELTSLFAEVRSVMGRPGYWEMLQRSKVKAGQYVSVHLFDALMVLFDWLCLILDDAAILFDSRLHLDLLERDAISDDRDNAGEACDQMKRVIETVNLIRERGELVALRDMILPLCNEDNYGLSLLTRLLSRESQPEVQRLVEEFYGCADVLVRQCILMGGLDLNEKIVKFLNSNPYVSSSPSTQSVFRKQSVSDLISGAGSVVESIVSLLVHRKKDIGISVSQWDEHQSSPFLLLCQLEMWTAADLLLDSANDCDDSILSLAFRIIDAKPSDPSSRIFCSLNSQVGSCLRSNKRSFLRVTPLHFALFHGNSNFIYKLFSTNPNYSVDSSIFEFSCASNCWSLGLDVLNQSSRINCLVLSDFSFFAHTEFAECDLKARKVLNVLSKTRQMTEIEYFTSCLDRRSNGRTHKLLLPQYMGLFQGFTLVGESADSSKQSKHPSHLALLDGSNFPMEHVLQDAAFLCRMLPSPTTNAYFGPFSSFVHAAAEISHGDRDFLVDVLSLSHARPFAVNKTGQSALHSLSRHSHFDLIGETVRKYLPTSRLEGNMAELSRSQSMLPLEPRLQRVLLETAKQNVTLVERELESKRREMLFAPPSTANLGLLTEMIARTQHLWSYIRQSDFMKMIQVSYSQSGAILDSLIRARQVLMILGIPFSHLSTDGHPPTGQRTGSRFKRHQCFEYLDPTNLRKSLTTIACAELKEVLAGWFRLQMDNEPSLCEQSLFLFHRNDVSCQDIGEQGVEILRRKLPLGTTRPLNRIDVSRGYFYMNSCNDHIKDLGSKMGRRFVSRRILTTSSAKKTEMVYDMLPAQLKTETKVPYRNLAKSPKATSKKIVTSAGDNQLSLFMSKQLVGLIENWRENSDGISQALRLAYVLLDFARCLLSCRLMVAMTQDESGLVSAHQSNLEQWSLASELSPPSKESQVASLIPRMHPLDDIMKKKDLTLRTFQRVTQALDSKNTSDFGMGSKTRIKILDGVSVDQLSSLFRMKRDLSSRLFRFKEAVLEGLATLLMAIGELRLCEFVCKTSRRVVTVPGAAHAHDGQAGGDADRHGREVEASIYRDMLDCLQRLSIHDVIESCGKSSSGLDLLKELEKSRQSLLSLKSDMAILSVDTHDSAAHANTILLDVPIHASSQEYADIEFLFGSNPAGMDRDKKSREGDAVKLSKKIDIVQEIREDVDRAYHAANHLSWFIQAVANVKVLREFFKIGMKEDVFDAQNCDLLVDMCVPSQLRDSKRISKDLRWETDCSSDMLTCCRHLVSMWREVPTSITAVICSAALLGKLKVLQIILSSEKFVKDSVRAMKFLVWNTLMVCPSKSVGSVRDKVEESNNFHKCVEMLITHDFPVQTPSSVAYTCWDLLVLKQFYQATVALEVALKQRRLRLQKLAAPDSTDEPLPDQFHHFRAIHLAQLVHEISPDYYQDILDLSFSSFDAACLTASKVFFPKTLPSDVSVHIQFVKQVCPVKSFFADWELFWERRLKFHFWTAASNLIPFRWRNPLCPLWRTVRRDLMDLCPHLIPREKSSESNGNRRSNVFIPSEWTNLHMCMASRTTRWFHFMADKLLQSPSLDRVSQVLLSVVQYACFYDDYAAFNWTVQVVRSLTSTDPSLSGIFSEADNFEPFGRRASLMDICLTAVSPLSMVKVIEFGQTLTLKDAAALVSSGKYCEAACVQIMEAAFVSSSAEARFGQSSNVWADFHVPLRFDMVGVVPGEQLIHLCARRGFSTLVRLLLVHGAPYQSVDPGNLDVLRCGVGSGQRQVTKELGHLLSRELVPLSSEYHIDPQNELVAANTLKIAFRIHLLRRHRTRK